MDNTLKHENITNDIETFMAIPEHDNYEVSNFGNVRKKGALKLLKVSSGGTVSFSMENNKRTSKSVARLVALTFINSKTNHIVRHLDNNHLNNHVSNLFWFEPKPVLSKNINENLAKLLDQPESYKYNIKINEIINILCNCDVQHITSIGITLDNETFLNKIPLLTNYFKNNQIFFKQPKSHKLETGRQLLGALKSELSKFGL